MKNAFKILKRDLKNIFTNSMAIVLVVGIIALPSLYAWFNIYANWDPYGKTGNMMVAVCNEDEGTTYRDITIDVGDEIVNNLKGNKSIDWQFVSKKEAVDGVESGKYYAAIEIPKGFSKNLASIVTDEYERPQIIYYANEKKNAIATKITDKVVQTVQTTVNESFVSTVVSILNRVLGVALESDLTTGENTFDYLKEQINTTRGTVGQLQDSIHSFEEVMGIAKELNASLDEKDLNSLLNNCGNLINDTQDTIKVTQTTVDSIFTSMGTIMSSTSQSLSSLANTVEKIGNMDATEAMDSINQVKKEVGLVKEEIEDIAKTLESVNKALPNPVASVNDLIKRLNNISKSLDVISKSLDAVTKVNYKEETAEIAAKLRNVAKALNETQSTYVNDIKPTLTKSVDSLTKTLADLSVIVDKLQQDTPSINTLVSTLQKSASAGDNMVVTIGKLLDSTDQKLSNLYDKIDAISKSELVNAIVNLTDGNADELGEFLACPVTVKTDKVYGIENYGSAMAPFYSTLAIWVGAMFLAAVIKTDVKKRKEIADQVTFTQRFFGRGTLYVMFATIQSLLIVLGDLLFLNIQCYHPIKFVFAGILASIVFSLFIFSLCFTFGDVGKAVGVILLVIQIGGSGGTFPIDVTQDFFVAVNPYLPFTFVIEAMRECICGEFGNNYWMYLLKLMAYAVAALIIGLPIKRVVKKPVRFFEKRIEETGLF